MGVRASTGGAVEWTDRDVLGVLFMSIGAAWWKVLTLFLAATEKTAAAAKTRTLVEEASSHPVRCVWSCGA